MSMEKYRKKQQEKDEIMAQVANFYEIAATIVEHILDEAVDSVFKVVNPTHVTQNLPTKKLIIASKDDNHTMSHIPNNNDKLKECIASLNSNAEVRATIDSNMEFTILRNLLNQDYFPEYLLITKIKTNLFETNICNSIAYLPAGHFKKEANILKEIRENNIKSAMCFSLRDGKTTFYGQPNILSPDSKLSFCHDHKLHGVSMVSSSSYEINECNVSGLSESSNPWEFFFMGENQSIKCLKLPNNNLKVIEYENKIEYEKGNVRTKWLSNKFPTKIPSDDVNVKHSTPDSCRMVSGLIIKNDILKSYFLESDQIVPIRGTQEIMQNTFGTKGESMQLKIGSQNKITLFWNSYTCNFGIHTDVAVNNIKAVPAKCFEVNNSNDFITPIQLEVKIDNSGPVHFRIKENTDCAIVSSLVPDVCDSSTSKAPITYHNSFGGNDNEITKANIYDSNNLNTLFKSSSLDNIGIDGCKQFIGIIKDKIPIELPLSYKDNDRIFNGFEASDIVELDKVIDDVIEKYEHFTQEVGVLAVPFTVDKSSQTENLLYDTAICKRCLENDDCEREPAKKAKLNLIEEDNINYCKLNLNDSIDMSLYGDEHHVAGKHQPPGNTCNCSSPCSTNGGEFCDLKSSVIVGALSSNGSIENRQRGDFLEPKEGDEVVGEDRCLFNDIEMDFLNEELHDSEQEVPTNQFANEEPNSTQSSSFLLPPKKPVLRVGLSRSGRFKPLHPRM